MQQHDSDYFALIPPPPPHTHTHDTDGWGPKIKNQLAQNMVMLHIKLKGMIHAAIWWQIFYPQIPPHTQRAFRRGQMVKINVFRSWSAYQIIGNHECGNMVQIFCPQTRPPLPDSWVGSKGQNSSFSEYGYVGYKI